MPTTSNFGWTTPADTDLVKDGAAAIRTLGNGIDTSFLDLKGGTTDQVLAKNSNTDLDFKWVAQDDSNAIQNAIVDAKGDLISATAADTPARLASSGVNGEVLTIDTSTATGLKWATVAAGGMTLISTTTLSGSSTALTSIPGTYTDLMLYIVNYYASSATGLNITVNGNTANYLAISTYNAAGTASAEQGVTGTFRATIANSQPTSDQENFTQIAFPFYANSTGQRLAVSNSAYTRSSDLNNVIEQDVGYLGISAPITSIEIKTGAGTWSGGTAYLYGVK